MPATILTNEFFTHSHSVTFMPGALPVGGFYVIDSVVYGGGATVSGYLYYYDSGTATWIQTNATAIGAGEDCRLAIAMGATPAAGMMTDGWYNVLPAAMIGAWVSEEFWMDTTAGHLATNLAVPAASGNVRRVIGYGEGVANTMRFHPDGAWAVVA
jgi:hypothetical protein